MAAVENVHEIAVPWDKLLLWVQQQIAYEIETGQPVALSRTQLEALSKLVPFLNEEPETDETDYVSRLMIKAQSSTLKPLFADKGHSSVPINGKTELRWAYTCTVEPFGTFPREGYGYAPGRQMPLFQSKKIAKQFAAKSTLKFLEEAARRETAVSASADTSTTHSAPPPIGKLPAVHEQVVALTRRLGLETPSYEVHPDPLGEDYFRGRPVFKVGSPRVPPDVGVVSGIRGQAATRLRVAEHLLSWLRAEQQRREEVDFQSMWGR